jgi:hypothetical protein
MVTGYVPGGVLWVAFTFRTALPVAEAVAGLKLALNPGMDEIPSTLRFRFPPKPPNEKKTRLKVPTPLLPTVAPGAPGATGAVIQKSGASALTEQAAGWPADCQEELASCPVVLFQDAKSSMVPARGVGMANAPVLELPA